MEKRIIFNACIRDDTISAHLTASEMMANFFISEKQTLRKDRTQSDVPKSFLIRLKRCRQEG
jgi:hypothetical protein